MDIYIQSYFYANKGVGSRRTFILSIKYCNEYCTLDTLCTFVSLNFSYMHRNPHCYICIAISIVIKIIKNSNIQ